MQNCGLFTVRSQPCNNLVQHRLFSKLTLNRARPFPNLFRKEFVVILRVGLQYLGCRTTTLLNKKLNNHIFLRIFQIFGMNYFSQHLHLCWKIKFHYKLYENKVWDQERRTILFVLWNKTLILDVEGALSMKNLSKHF